MRDFSLFLQLEIVQHKWVLGDVFLYGFVAKQVGLLDPPSWEAEFDCFYKQANSASQSDYAVSATLHIIKFIDGFLFFLLAIAPHDVNSLKWRTARMPEYFNELKWANLHLLYVL